MIAHVLLVAALVIGAPPVTPADAMKHGHEHADHEHGNHAFSGPLSKGLTAFHDTLHPLWHESYPKKDYTTIKRKLPELKARAKDLGAVPLPPGARAKRAQRDALIKAIDAADAAKQDDKKFGKAFSKVHDAFEALHETAGEH